MAPLRQEEYYEEFLTESLKPPKSDLPIEAKKVKPKTRTKRRVFLGITAFAIALTIVYRYAMISDMNMKNIKKKNELAEINNINSQLQLAAEKSINLSEVEKYASENLGLQKPQNYQIEYINIDKEDLIDNKNSNENKNWFQSVLFNIVEFFN